MKKNLSYDFFLLVSKFYLSHILSFGAKAHIYTQTNTTPTQHNNK